MVLFTPNNIKVSTKTVPIFIVKCLFFYMLGYTIGTLLEKWETYRPLKIAANIAIFGFLTITIPSLLGELQQTLPGLFFASVFNTQPSLYTPFF